MISLKRKLLLELMFENARANADGIGFLQHIIMRGGKVTVRNIHGTYDVSDSLGKTEVIDIGTRTMIECSYITPGELKLLAQILAKFPEGSQLVFSHSFSREECYTILSAYGVKIFEHVNLDAVAKKFGDEVVEKENCYYCLAVKI